MTRLRMSTALFACTALAAMTGVAGAQRGPAHEPVRLPPEVLALACAPGVATGRPAMPIRITGGQDSHPRITFAPGDLLTVNAGTQHGMEVGQEYFLRRVLNRRDQPITPLAPGVLQTSGWIRIYAVDDTMSLATITHACDVVALNDYLEPFVLPQPPLVRDDKRKAERDNYARVMGGIDERRTFGRGDFFTMNRGSDEGVTPGTHFVLFRDRRVPNNFLYEVGEAVAVEVRPGSSTLQITVSIDAIYVGDMVAQRR